MTDDLWTAPGPGSWKLDVTHFRGPLELLQCDAMARSLDDSFAAAFVDFGIALGTILFRPVPAGWYYGSGTPAPAGEMSARTAAAARALDARPWRDIAKRWREVYKPQFVARFRAEQDKDPAALDDKALAAHVRATSQLIYDGFYRHLYNYTEQAIGTGEWLSQGAAWAGVGPWDVVETLAGYSPGSTLARASLEELAGAVRAAPAAMALFKQGTPTLEALRASTPQVAAAVDHYIDEFGYRMIGGFHLSDVTLREVPQTLIEALAAVLEHERERPALQAQANAAAARLREKTAPENRAAFDQALADARAAYGSNDVDVVVLLFWPLGLMRRGALAAGERLVKRGRLAAREHAFDVTVDELDALLTGSAGGPSLADVAQRNANRLAWAKLEPPLFVGDPPQMPPPGSLPAPVERITSSFGLAWSLIDEDGQPASKMQAPTRGLTGHAASAGVYEGVARVIRGPDDFGRLRRGDVLVTRTTCPTYNMVLPMIGAIVTERGGALCHAAVVSREFGIPAVVGTGTATRDIPDGARVRVDGTRGVVERLA